MNEFKLVATDIDGTIVAHGGTVTGRTRAALHASRDAGLEVVLVTGRPPRWLPPVLEAADLEPMAICANGAVVLNSATGELLEASTFAEQVSFEIVMAMQAAAPDLVFAAESPLELRVGPGFQRLREMGPVREGLAPEEHRARGVESIDDLVAGDQIFKIVGVSMTETPDSLLAIAREQVGHLAEVTHSSTSRAVIEISPPGVTKAATLARFAAERGIQAAEVIAFGDMPNDAAMLAWAGHGYAMSGGHPEAVSAARHLAPPADDDGVAQILEQLLGLG